MATVIDSTKEMLDVWANTQKKVVENWVKSTHQVQEAAKEGKVLEQASDMYQSWYDEQKNILSEAVEKGKHLSSEHMPEQVTKFLEQQSTFSKKWMDMVKDMAERQSQMTKMLSEGKDVRDIVMDSYKSWFDGVTKTMNEALTTMPTPIKDMQSAFENMMSGAKSYFGVYDMWKPFMQMVNNQNFDTEQYFKMMNMEEWQKMAKNMLAQSPSQFGFFNLETMNEQTNRMMEQARSMMMQNPMLAPYKDWMNQYAEMIPNAAQNGFSPQFGEEIYERMQKLYAPFHKLMPPSKEKEVLQLFADMQKSFLQYQTKTSEMNVIVGQTVRQAAEEYMTSMFDAAKEGKTPQSYNEFYMNWLNLLEERMIEVFRGDEFSKVQGELLAFQLDLKSAFNKSMEQMLSPYPVALNSEIDELAKQVHALKAKVREMEKSQSTATAETPKTPAAKPKTTTRRKPTTK